MIKIRCPFCGHSMLYLPRLDSSLKKKFKSCVYCGKRINVSENILTL